MSDGGSAFVQLFMARMREFVREPEVVFWVFGFPILLALGLGIAFREKPQDVIAVAVVENADAARAAAALPKSAGFDTRVVPSEEAARQLRLGKVALVVTPGPAGAPVDYRFDPARPDSALARARIDDALQRAAGRADAVTVKETHVTEPGARYIDFLIPGLLGMNIMSGAMWGVGYAIVEMRVRKLLKRLVATPMRRWEFLGAMMGSRMVLVMLELVLLLFFGWLVFGMQVRGSLLLVGFVTLLGAFAFTGLALLVSSRAKKTESVTGIMNLVMLPMFVLSGVFFSSDRFPDVAQPFIKLLPLTALNDALRATILEGAGVAAQPGRLLLLLLWGAIPFAIALRTFRWS